MLLGGLIAWSVQAQPVPFIGTFAGANPKGVQTAKFDETRVITAPINENITERQTGPGWETLEGRITHAYWALPAGVSSLEALRNYEQNLREQGFTIAFICASESQGAGSCWRDTRGRPGLALGMELDGNGKMPKLGNDWVRNYFFRANGRYLYATLDRPSGKVHAAIGFSDDEQVTGRMVFARVIESAALQTGQVQVITSSAIAQGLGQSGRLSLYGILFAFDKADIEPGSDAQLREIAAVLHQQPKLRLQVVGHTDNQGAPDYNQRLSLARAQAVVAALVQRHGIPKGRLTAQGQGASTPVGSNATEEGRQQNRRVELVRQ